jgi:ElaB/YqjD/DUF883 family membrane-anchored ribosome-binding protein
MRSTSPNTPNALGRDINNVVSDAQELLKTVQDEGESKLADVKAKASAQLDTAKQKFGEIQQTVQDGAKLAMNETDAYVRGNPWTSIGIGVAIGAVIGYLASSAARRD